MAEQNGYSFPVRVIIATGIVIAMAAFALLLWEVRTIVILLFLSLLLATLWRAASRPLIIYAKTPERLAVATTLLAAVIVFALLMLLPIPSLVVEAERLIEALPGALADVEATLRATTAGAALLDQIAPLEELAPDEDVITRIFTTATATGRVLADLALVVFVSVFFASNPSLYRDGIIRLVPLNKRERARQVLAAVGESLRSWLLARLTSMAAVGVMVTVGLSLLNVPLALFLGVLAGLLDFIPYVGPLIAAVPAVLVAFAESPVLALWVAVLFVVIQQIESFAISPLIYQRAVKLPPVLTITMFFVFGILFGFLGLVAAAPLTAVILILIRTLYVEEVLGDHA